MWNVHIQNSQLVSPGLYFIQKTVQLENASGNTNLQPCQRHLRVFHPSKLSPLFLLCNHDHQWMIFFIISVRWVRLWIKPNGSISQRSRDWSNWHQHNNIIKHEKKCNFTQCKKLKKKKNSVDWILSEIDFGESRIAKKCHFYNFTGPDFDLSDFLQIMIGWIYQKIKMVILWNCQNGSFDNFEVQKFNFTEFLESWIHKTPKIWKW